MARRGGKGHVCRYVCTVGKYVSICAVFVSLQESGWSFVDTAPLLLLAAPAELSFVFGVRKSVGSLRRVFFFS